MQKLFSCAASAGAQGRTSARVVLFSRCQQERTLKDTWPVYRRTLGDEPDLGTEARSNRHAWFLWRFRTEGPTSPKMFKLKASLPPGAAESEIFTILMKKSWAGFSASLIQNAAVCRAHLLHVPAITPVTRQVPPPRWLRPRARLKPDDIRGRTAADTPDSLCY